MASDREPSGRAIAAAVCLWALAAILFVGGTAYLVGLSLCEQDCPTTAVKAAAVTFVIALSWLPLMPAVDLLLEHGETDAAAPSKAASWIATVLVVYAIAAIALVWWLGSQGILTGVSGWIAFVALSLIVWVLLGSLLIRMENRHRRRDSMG